MRLLYSPADEGGLAVRAERLYDVRALHDLHPPARSRRRVRPLGGGLKRGIDLVGALLALALLSPLLLTVAIWVRLDSQGPIFFLQRRGGYRGRTFLVVKFRTMSALEDGTVTQASDHDERVTKVGALLRATSIDELPQLWNVVRGEMSLVGPRPHAVSHDREFFAVDPSYRGRRRARPGITGLAQVSGSRGPTPTKEAVRERVRLDLHYVEHWSVWLDGVIVLRTIRVLLRGERNAF